MSSPLRIPHVPLSDAQWHSLLPHLPSATHESQRGRPCDLRAHFDAFFRVAATDGPWRELPEEYGKPATISRHFRRLTHAGLWENLLRALAAAPARHPLRAIEGLICRATRRAIRLRGLALILLIRRLGLKRALPGPPWMVANPILSQTLASAPVPAMFPLTRKRKRHVLSWLRAMRHCFTVAAGRPIPRALKAAWP